jgi:hypothetical protein
MPLFEKSKSPDKLGFAKYGKFMEAAKQLPNKKN